MAAAFCTASPASASPARAIRLRRRAELVRRIRQHTTLPIALGFGISRPEHVAEVAAYADAAVVGSALVALIAEASESVDLAARVEDYVRWLKGASINAHA